MHAWESCRPPPEVSKYGKELLVEITAKLVDFTKVDLIDGTTPAPLPPPRTLRRDIRDAKAFRQHIFDHMHTAVCACCSRYRMKCLVKSYDYIDVENLDLLKISGPKSDNMPRHARTTYGPYCLQPAACQAINPDAFDFTLDLCDECINHLHRGRVPPCSLVYIDTGSIPSSPNPELDLAPLTIIEELLVAFNRVIRYVMVFYPTPAGLSVRQHCFRGNVIAFPNAPVSDVIRALPLPLDKIPEIIQVVFVTKCSKPEEIQEALNKAKALKIRGQNVAKWAIHLHKVIQYLFSSANRIQSTGIYIDEA